MFPLFFHGFQKIGLVCPVVPDSHGSTPARTNIWPRAKPTVRSAHRARRGDAARSIAAVVGAHIVEVS